MCARVPAALEQAHRDAADQITAAHAEAASQVSAAARPTRPAARERDDATEAARRADTETARARQAEADARAETDRVRADAARERDALRDQHQAHWTPSPRSPPPSAPAPSAPSSCWRPSVPTGVTSPAPSPRQPAQPTATRQATPGRGREGRPAVTGTALVGGGGSIAEGAVWPGRRKRGGVAGLPCSDGCNRSLVEFAATAVGVCAVAVGVCAIADGGDKPIAARVMKPATADARQRRLPGDRLAPKARTSANVRVTSEAAKANHRHGA